MENKHRIEFDVWLGIAAAIFLDTAVQITWKISVSQVPDKVPLLEVVRMMLLKPLFYGTIAMFLLQFVNWMRVLSKAELSFVQPITALSYITVALFSTLLLHEKLTTLQIVGTAFILAGVFFISQTGAKAGES